MLRCLTVVLLLVSSSLAEPPILPESERPGEMMQRWLLKRSEKAQAKWREAYEQRKTPEQWEAYRTELRAEFVERIGGLPEKSPLKPRIVGRVEREGFSVEKVLLESRPDFYVSGALFKPDATKFPPPWPGVLVVCGHTRDGKAYGMYQQATALLALHGMAGFIIDPVGQGERMQLLDPDGRPVINNPTEEHTVLGLGSILLGRNTAQFMIHDGMRAIDYLQSRDDIDGTRIGCMGNSGGGTQTSYLMALDPRIQAASPSCYLTGFDALLHTIGPQDAEQNIFGQVAIGLDHADYILLRAPKPTLICAATQDFFDIRGTWRLYRDAKRLYTRQGHPERVDLVENDDKHGWKQPLREAAVGWMNRWLRNGEQSIREPEIEPLSPAEIRCTPDGQTVVLPGAVSAFELNRRLNARLAPVRERLWARDPQAALAAVRKLSGIRPLAELPPAPSKSVGPSDAFVIRWDDGIMLPGVRVQPEPLAADAAVVLLLPSLGVAAELEQRKLMAPHVKAKREIVLADLRGIGATAPTNGTWYNPRFGKDGRDVTLAYLLGRSYVGMRAEDILVLARQFKQEGRKLYLVADGPLTVPALHAAALEPELIDQVELHGGLDSWSGFIDQPNVRDQWVHIVHGALTRYDLPDLRTRLGQRLDWKH